MSFQGKTEEDKIKDPVFDFIVFVLKYYQHLDYSDFTESVPLISRVKREEMCRAWVEMEETIQRFEGLESHFAATREVSTKSYEELYAYISRLAKGQESRLSALETRLNEMESNLNLHNLPSFHLIEKHEKMLNENLPRAMDELAQDMESKLSQHKRQDKEDKEGIADQFSEIQKTLGRISNLDVKLEKKLKENYDPMNARMNELMKKVEETNIQMHALDVKAEKKRNEVMDELERKVKQGDKDCLSELNKAREMLENKISSGDGELRQLVGKKEEDLIKRFEEDIDEIKKTVNF